MRKKLSVDKYLFFNILILIIVGLVIFLSASLGLLAKNGAAYSSVVLNQLVLGLIGGSIAGYIASRIQYTFWKKHSFWFFLGALLLTAAVWVPGIGAEFGGAKRWILLGPLSFQPSEVLKIAYIIYLASWLSVVRGKITTFKYGTLPFLIISALAGGILIAQPDNDTAMIMLLAGAVMYIVAGANLKHIIPLGIGALGLAGVILSQRAYILDRIITFLNPAADPLASGYQIQQSLIAIGSGGMFGRGFGQSVQKFNLLPEPISDSIFAVASEEFGFIGAFILVALFISLLIRSAKISLRSRDSFGGLLVLGFAILIVSQSFLNMASMLGIFPLSGLPLLFVSHGGTALFFTLFASGIMLNISKYQTKS
jgi:cell division protein FtsW